METTRQKKVAKLIQQSLSLVFQREVSVLPGILLTVNQVRMSPDLSIATSYISVMPAHKRGEAVDAIRQKTWEVRKKLASHIRMQLRIVPELRFFEDDTQDYALKMDRIFDDLKADGKLGEEE